MKMQIVENKERKKIESYLAQVGKASINQIAEATGLSWATVKKHLEYLEGIGRVHGEHLGNSIIYFFNGNGKWQKRVHLNSTHILFLDTFISPFGEPFIRIKEVKKKGDKWVTFGEVMITKERIEDVKEFLETIKRHIDIYSAKIDSR